MAAAQVLGAQRLTREWRAAHRRPPATTAAGASPGPTVTAEQLSMADVKACDDIRPSRAPMPPEAAACERLARQGFGPAQYKLGLLNAMAVGAEHSETAEKWFRRVFASYRQAADRGIAQAALVVASMYQGGSALASPSGAWGAASGTPLQTLARLSSTNGWRSMPGWYGCQLTVRGKLSTP
jgi:hypothetical protein